MEGMGQGLVRSVASSPEFIPSVPTTPHGSEHFFTPRTTTTTNLQLVILDMSTNFNAMEVDGSHATAPFTLAHPTPTDLPETDHIVLNVDGHKYRT
jgi:hypothetical protein